MKKIDINELQKRRYENYEKEAKNLIVTKVPGGYSVSNIGKATSYNVTKNGVNKNIECTCKDFDNFKGALRCKHIIAVLKKAIKINAKAQVTEDNIIINKEEAEMNSNNSKFNPQSHLTKIKGKDYLEVKYRVHWFRTEHPDYSIKTEMVQLDIEKGIAVVKADIYDSTGKHLSTGHKMEYQKNFFDYAEKSETGAIGRALACLGYGTLQCFELEEGIEKGRIVDAPVTPPVKAHKAPAAPTISTASSTTKTTLGGTSTIPTTSVNAPATTKPSTMNTAQSTAGSGTKKGGGNGKGGNGSGDIDINNIIKRW